MNRIHNCLSRWIAQPLFLLFALYSCHQAAAQEKLEYNRDIRPILAEHCFACHGPDSAARKAGLRLDREEDAIDSGSIVPNDPDDSEVIERIFCDDEDLIMPPPEMKKALSDSQKQLLKQWVTEGAKYQPHWSFITPQKKSLPQVQNTNWSKNPIDRFIQAKLESLGIEPAAEATTARLFRRLHLDITGLPPNPDDVVSFIRDYEKEGDEALSRWIDRLMETPAWGEHRARYWLDAARYGDTHGLHFDNYREMWPYRDWVIRSFNRNQPFDEFTVEQLAGDLLPNPSESQLIATGFQRCNITTNEGGTIKEENLALYASDRVQTYGWVYMGLTTNCAQCHDHKFDPTSMKDYYSLAAFFRNTTQPALDGNVKDGRGPILVVPSEQDRPRWKSLPDEIVAATKRRENRRGEARSDFETWLTSLSIDSIDQELSKEKLVVQLPLNEGQGNLISNVITGKKFKSTGDVDWSGKGSFGPAAVMKLKGTFDLGELGNFELDQAFSFGAWIKAKRKGSGGIIARMNERNAYRGWDLFQNGGGFAVHLVDAWPGNALKASTAANTLKQGTWQHVFATYDGSGKIGGIKIYIDGKEQKLTVERDSLKPNASILAKTPLRVGQRSHQQVFAGGSLQDVRIYERLLPPDEVKRLSALGPLQQWLQTAESERTAEQRESFFRYYLQQHDQAFIALAKAVSELEAEKEAIRVRSPITHVQEEKPNNAAMANILMRGEYDNLGEVVSAETPKFLPPMETGLPKNRLGLAKWTVDPANPLTARVTVNRFWQEIFGRGLVVTPEDFGVMGAQPSHPDLLDWLAVEFQESDWNVKQLFKLILMSATYRQSARVTSQKLEFDPSNTFLSRGPRFRMDAEMVRDSALSISGLLSDKMYGPSVKPYQPDGLWDIVGLPGGDTRNFVQSKGEDLYRKSLYTFRKRMSPPPNLEAFNSPSREFCVVKRERTNTPLQALVTLNDPQFVEAARVLAQNAMKANPSNDEILNFISNRVLGRTFEMEERKIIFEDHSTFLSYYRQKQTEAQAFVATGESAVDETLDVVELAAWTLVCNQILNLDETITK